MGPFFKRPLEAYLARLVESWQFSQPRHLRHLSLIRDTALRGTISHYVQYSLRNFLTLVNDGHASWEAVEFQPRQGKSKVAVAPPTDAVPELDGYGFPTNDRPHNLLRDGDATLRECLEFAKPQDHVLTTNDPIALEFGAGKYGMRILPNLLRCPRLTVRKVLNTVVRNCH